ncbi:MAG: HD domain-containing protein [Elusimicrobia bacterium]|nr:HD domain-containing protein [Elusimicrobiota bacterium]
MGGALRDAALRRPVADVDLACAGDAEALARALAGKVGGSFVELDEATRVYRVALPEGQVDVAALQGGGIDRDLARRDFGLNAMARLVEPNMGGGARLGPLLDPRGGASDLRRRVLRASGPEPFAEDPLRLLRAYRIAAQLGLSIDPATRRWIRKLAARVRRCAGERVRAELLSLLAEPGAHAWLRRMDEDRLLTAVFPELEKQRRCARGYYGAGGVLRHTLDAVERMDLLLDRLGSVFPGLAKQIRERVERWNGKGGSALLRLAVLLHDVAKPATARVVGGRLRFFGHDERGAAMARRELGRLRLSGREIAGVEACVRHHLRPGNLATNRSVTPKAIYRFFRDLGDHGVPLLLVCWADFSSYMPLAKLRRAIPTLAKDPGPPPADPERGKTVRHLRLLSLLLKAYFRRAEIVRPPRLLTGHDVMKALGIPPGPAVGKALERLTEAQAAGKVEDREAALRFVSRLRVK